MSASMKRPAAAAASEAAKAPVAAWAEGWGLHEEGRGHGGGAAAASEAAKAHEAARAEG